MGDEKLNRLLNDGKESCESMVHCVKNIEKLISEDSLIKTELDALKTDISKVKHYFDGLKKAENLKLVILCENCINFCQTSSHSYCNVTGMRKSPKDWCEQSAARNHETLCWQCKNAASGCSWSQNFTPVKGWNATPKLIGKEQSYIVKDCPEFERDIFNAKAETKDDFNQNEDFWVED